jgi:uncharacterized membrane protein AbrB (regulator of aidB expression)
MLTLGGLIALYFAAVVLGKHSRRVSAGTVVILLLIAILQTGAVLFDMFTKQPPAP